MPDLSLVERTEGTEESVDDTSRDLMALREAVAAIKERLLFNDRIVTLETNWSRDSKHIHDVSGKAQGVVLLEAELRELRANIERMEAKVEAETSRAGLEHEKLHGRVSAVARDTMSAVEAKLASMSTGGKQTLSLVISLLAVLVAAYGAFIK